MACLRCLQVLACLPPTPWVISEKELQRRRDFRQEAGKEDRGTCCEEIEAQIGGLNYTGSGASCTAVHIALPTSSLPQLPFMQAAPHLQY